MFIINGWKSIIKIGLCLIKHFEIKILSCDLDDLLHFLINDILKFDFFQNENYDNLRNIDFTPLKLGHTDYRAKMDLVMNKVDLYLD